MNKFHLEGRNNLPACGACGFQSRDTYPICDFIEFSNSKSACKKCKVIAIDKMIEEDKKVPAKLTP